MQVKMFQFSFSKLLEQCIKLSDLRNTEWQQNFLIRKCFEGASNLEGLQVVLLWVLHTLIHFSHYIIVNIIKLDYIRFK